MKKVVLITGASGGFGKEVAKLFISKGIYQLILNGRNDNGLEEFKNNPDVEIVVGDLTKQETVDKLGEAVQSKKHIDILINNAGINIIKPFETNTYNELIKLLNIDLIAPIQLTQKVYPLMVKQQSGHIININSTAGLEEKLNHTMYNAAKFGLTGFTKSLRLEARKHNIRITSFHPGGMNTDFYDEMEGIPVHLYMDPKKVAEILIQLVETDPSLTPDEIVINRMTK